MADDGTRVVDRCTPEEAFALLGDATRVAILRALGESIGDPLSFSTLRERVGVRDSGQFNYHLGKLTGQFVRRTEAGYELTLAGAQVVGALLAGTYTADVTMAPVDVDAPCPRCGEPLVAEYADEHVRVHCTDCGEWENRFTFPPGALDQFDRAALPAAFDRWLRTEFARVVAGFCPNCSGRMRATLQPTDEGPEPARVRYRCERCGNDATASATMPLLYHPAAIGFYYDHGVDVTATPSWEIADRQDEREVAVVSTDPPEVRVTVVVDGEALVATVDASGRVASVECRDVPD